MSKEERKVPELRFKGFHDDWEQRKLGNVVSFYSGLTYSPKDVVSKNGVFVIRSSNIQNNNIVSADDVYVDFSVANSKHLSIDDVIVVVRNGSRSLIGKHAIVKKDMVNTVIGAFMTGIQNDTPNFINALLDTEKFRNEIHKNLGATINQITTGTFKKMKFNFPENEERFKIGQLIRQLDDIITLHRRKRNILQKLKQIYLMKMNPKKEKISPELYFSNCSRTWEQRKLSSIYNVTMGHSPKSENYTSNPEDYILVQGNADIKNGWVKPRVWTTQITSLVMAGSILLSVRAPVGNVGKTSYDVVIGRGIASIEGDEFIYQLLSKMHMENFWRKFSTGSTFESINSKDIKDALIKVPTNKEREKIGSFLEIIDSYIVHQNDTVHSLIKLKDSYLAKMFL